MIVRQYYLLIKENYEFILINRKIKKLRNFYIWKKKWEKQYIYTMTRASNSIRNYNSIINKLKLQNKVIKYSEMESCFRIIVS